MRRLLSYFSRRNRISQAALHRYVRMEFEKLPESDRRMVAELTARLTAELAGERKAVA